MTSLSTLRDKSWSICGEEEGECMEKEDEEERRGERKGGGEVTRKDFYSFIGGRELAGRFRAGIGIDTVDGRMAV
jgi:hypothetical protein